MAKTEVALYGDATLYRGISTSIEPVFDGPRSAVPLGFNEPGSRLGLCWDIVGGQGHGCTFGAARSGKGTCAIIPALLTYGSGCVVIDPKGENLWATGEFRGRSRHHPNGGFEQKVIALDPWEETTRRYGSKVGVTVPLSTFNPLSILDPKSLDFADKVAELAEGIIIAGGSTEPHWPESARELVGGLMAAVVEWAANPPHGTNAPPEVPTFRNVREKLTQSDDELALYIKRICKLMPNSIAARKLARFSESTREVASIRSTAITQTAILDAGRLMACMDTGPNSFDINELATGFVTLYLVLPVDKLYTHGKWLRLMLQLAMRSCMHGASIDRPILFILDELGTITPGHRGGGLPLVSQAFGLAAGLGVRLWCFFQDLSQLQRDYPESWSTFLANSTMIQLLRVNEINTARYFSEHLGTYTHRERGQIHARPLRLPQEIMKMSANNTLIMLQGGKNYELTKLYYYTEPRLAGRFRPNPDYKETVVLPIVHRGLVKRFIRSLRRPDGKLSPRAGVLFVVAITIIFASYKIIAVRGEVNRQAAYNDRIVSISMERSKLNASDPKYRQLQAEINCVEHHPNDIAVCPHPFPYVVP